MFPPLDSVSYGCSVRLNMNEITKVLNPEQIKALFEGIAKVLSANPYEDDNKRLADIAALERNTQATSEHMGP